MLRRGLFVLALVALAGCLGCEKDKGKGEEPAAKEEGAKLDPGQEYMMSSGQKDLAEIAKKKPEELTHFDCIAPLTAVTELGAVKNDKVLKFIAEAKQTCGHDVPLTMLKREAAKIEAKRKNKPDEKFMTECVEFKMAMGELKKHGHESLAEFKQAAELHKAACE
jgi:hypothetical protein